MEGERRPEGGSVKSSIRLRARASMSFHHLGRRDDWKVHTMSCLYRDVEELTNSLEQYHSCWALGELVSDSHRLPSLRPRRHLQ